MILGGVCGAVSSPGHTTLFRDGSGSMGYYVRAFCTASQPPPLQVVLDALAASGVALSAEGVPPEDLREADWDEAAIGFAAGQPPALVTCDRQTGAHNLVREEVQQFIEFLQDAPASPERKRVVDHLRATKFIVACRLPESAADEEDGSCAAGRAFLSYFVAHCGGLVQADGRGFYEGDRIILAVGETTEK
jgi:hypothetical protein